jgi:hypothetical protein
MPFRKPVLSEAEGLTANDPKRTVFGLTLKFS